MTTDEELTQIYGKNAKEAFYEGVNRGQKGEALELICKECGVDYIK